ncbi:MAG TPA: GerMN domain-containing protein [Terracidiphilus sp.]|nr:GerMN domain-containing protein [Terracidiphilus sp.]
MIPRYQKILFVILLAASLAMGGVLWYLLDRAHQRLLTGQDSAPTRAPQVAPAEQATLLVANDADGSLVAQVQSLPLPADPGARARAVLGKLLDLYAAEGSTHPVQGGAVSIAQVFLLAAPESKPAASQGAQVRPVAASRASSGANGPLLAVVNFTSNFAAGHPSGIETETLTLLSICGTLRANLPRVAEVRFLIDGQQHPTLAGHADLTRTYLTAEAAPGEGAKP